MVNILEVIRILSVNNEKLVQQVIKLLGYDKF